MRMIKTALILLLSSTIPATADMQILQNCKGNQWSRVTQFSDMEERAERITGQMLITDRHLLLGITDDQGEYKTHKFKFIHEQYNLGSTLGWDGGKMAYYAIEDKGVNYETAFRYVLARKDKDDINFHVFGNWALLRMWLTCKIS